MLLKFFNRIILIALFPFAMQAQDFEVIFDDAPPASVKNEKITDRSEQQQQNATSVETATSYNEKQSSKADTIRLSIVEKAREYIGVNYRYGHSDEQGFDCSGYVRFVYSKFGFTLPHSSSEQYKQSRHIKNRKALPGDLVFFQTRGKPIGHVGIYLGDNSFIHAPSRGKQVCIESLDSAYYKSRLAGFGTFLK
ncbi:MAG: C40 family peptidase [Bacteroidales bacterium]|nr:C40 family peptidase [Bacteroidales bacterium]